MLFTGYIFHSDNEGSGFMKTHAAIPAESVNKSI